MSEKINLEDMSDLLELLEKLGDSDTSLVLESYFSSRETFSSELEEKFVCFFSYQFWLEFSDTAPLLMKVVLQSENLIRRPELFSDILNRISKDLQSPSNDKMHLMSIYQVLQNNGYLPMPPVIRLEKFGPDHIQTLQDLIKKHQ